MRTMALLISLTSWFDPWHLLWWAIPIGATANALLSSEQRPFNTGPHVWWPPGIKLFFATHRLRTTAPRYVQSSCICTMLERKHTASTLWRTQGPGAHTWALEKPGMFNTYNYLLYGEDTHLFLLRKIRMDVANSLGIFAIWRASPRPIPQTIMLVYPKLFVSLLLSPDDSSLWQMTPVLYSSLGNFCYLQGQADLDSCRLIVFAPVIIP